MKRKMYGQISILFKESGSLSIGLNTSLWTIGGLNYYFICEEALPVRLRVYLGIVYLTEIEIFFAESTVNKAKR